MGSADRKARLGDREGHVLVGQVARDLDDAPFLPRRRVCVARVDVASLPVLRRGDAGPRFLIVPEWGSIADDEELVTLLRVLLSEGRVVHGTVDIEAVAGLRGG